MSESPDSHKVPHPREEIEVINTRGAEAAQMAARLLCRETVEIVYDTTNIHLQADEEQHRKIIDEGFPVGEVEGFFVLQDRFTAPRKEGKLIRTFSTRLEPTDSKDTQDYMRLHVPVGDKKIQDYELPPQLEVEDVYIELHEDGDTHWYAIGSNGLYEYIPELWDEERGGVLTDQGVWRWLNERVPESFETITNLFSKLINWETTPQKIEPIPEIE